MLQDAYQKEMGKFDRERVLPAWDGLITRQQGQLEALGVPNMFVTSDPRDTEVRFANRTPSPQLTPSRYHFLACLCGLTQPQRQKQIIHVLLGLVGNV